MALSGPDAPVKVGTSYSVDVVVTNTTDGVFALPRTNGERQAYRDYTITVIDPQGKVLLPSKPQQNMGEISDPPLHSSFHFKRLHPSDSFVDHIWLSDLFQLTTTGRYKVEVQRAIPPEEGGGIIKSNQITLAIVE